VARKNPKNVINIFSTTTQTANVALKPKGKKEQGAPPRKYLTKRMRGKRKESSVGSGMADQNPEGPCFSVGDEGVLKSSA